VARQCCLKCGTPFLYESGTVENISSTLELSPMASPRRRLVQPRTTVPIKYACRPDARCPVQMSSFCYKITLSTIITVFGSYGQLLNVHNFNKSFVSMQFQILELVTCFRCLKRHLSWYLPECIMVTIAVRHARMTYKPTYCVNSVKASIQAD
jgi:hypothetical protein